MKNNCDWGKLFNEFKRKVIRQFNIKNFKEFVEKLDFCFLIKYPVAWTYSFHIIILLILPGCLIDILLYSFLKLRTEGTYSNLSIFIFYFVLISVCLISFKTVKNFLRSPEQPSYYYYRLDKLDFNANYGVRNGRHQEYIEFFFCVVSSVYFVLLPYLFTIEPFVTIDHSVDIKKVVQDIHTYNKANLYLRFLTDDIYAIELVTYMIDPDMFKHDPSYFMDFRNYAEPKEQIDNFLISRFQKDDTDDIKTDLQKLMKLYIQYSEKKENNDSTLKKKNLNSHPIIEKILLLWQEFTDRNKNEDDTFIIEEKDVDFQHIADKIQTRFYELNPICIDAYKLFYENKNEKVKQNKELREKYLNQIEQKFEIRNIDTEAQDVSLQKNFIYLDFLRAKVVKKQLKNFVIYRQLFNKNYDLGDLTCLMIYLTFWVATILFGFKYLHKKSSVDLNNFLGKLAFVGIVVLFIVVFAQHGKEINNKATITELMEYLSDSIEFLCFNSFFHLGLKFLYLRVFIQNLRKVYYFSRLKYRSEPKFSGFSVPNSSIFLFSILLPHIFVVILSILEQLKFLNIGSYTPYHWLSALGILIYLKALPWITKYFLRMNSLPS